jgi:hypothetical protein
MRNTSTGRRKKAVTPVETKSIKMNLPDENRFVTGCMELDDAENGLGIGDLTIVDKLIKPACGDLVIYNRGKDFLLYTYEGKKPKHLKTYRMVGVVTHVLKCIHKGSDDVLNAEFLTLEASK